MSWNIPVRYLRIWMTESSNTCDTHGAQDKRNCVGYAIDELYIGTLAADGPFTDIVKHLPSRQQTVTGPLRWTRGTPPPIWTTGEGTKSDSISSSIAA
jgi:hypothetical protein